MSVFDPARAPIALLALASLSGCASLLGGNVRGDFQCRAPGGTCAPSAKIDDQAIGAILTPTDEVASAAATAERRPARVTHGIALAARSREKVLRIVFPSFIDEQGRLHEASAIHAVVEHGDWQLPAVAAHDGPSFAEADGQRADAEAPVAAVSDPPSEAAVAAARARAPASVEAIRTEVEARIAAHKAAPEAPSVPTAVPASGAGAQPVQRAEPFAPPVDEQ
ncbi:MAG: TraV family lipoprotein [Sphingopyxis sp.]|uniref:TraV family lipoprotein n=1 Tax=Sphingopyxis sp. TaxID=1908224 RepID=UPI001A28A91D|nr:TraV family lipoprotein [Sphingopyxis sp.]MBJ7499646.1 TraV family lipoprotein [Sphingopyxis sp.]